MSTTTTVKSMMVLAYAGLATVVAGLLATQLFGRFELMVYAGGAMILYAMGGVEILHQRERTTTLLQAEERRVLALFAQNAVRGATARAERGLQSLLRVSMTKLRAAQERAGNALRDRKAALIVSRILATNVQAIPAPDHPDFEERLDVARGMATIRLEYDDGLDPIEPTPLTRKADVPADTASATAEGEPEPTSAVVHLGDVDMECEPSVEPPTVAQPQPLPPPLPSESNAVFIPPLPPPCVPLLMPPIELAPLQPLPAQ